MNFDVSRLRKSDQIIGGSAVLFFIFLFFFKWYGGSSTASVGGVNVSSSFSGWHTFTNSRWIWLITIIVALVAVAVAGGALKFHTPVQMSVLVAGLGALSTILIVIRIIHHPSGGLSGTIDGVHYSSSYGIKIGIWLGLIAAAGVAYGGYLAMRDEGTSIADVREQASAAVSSMGSHESSATAPENATSTGVPASSEPLAPPIAPPAEPEPPANRET